MIASIITKDGSYGRAFKLRTPSEPLRKISEPFWVETFGDSTFLKTVVYFFGLRVDGNPDLIY
jgi:hypothetical protein